MKAKILLLTLAAGVVALSSPSFAASPGNYVMMPQMQGDAQREMERSYAYPSYRYVAPGYAYRYGRSIHRYPRRYYSRYSWRR